MTDEQTAAAIVADPMNSVSETAMETAIVRALQAARRESIDSSTPPDASPMVWRNGKKCAPAGHIIDDQGVVRRVLGTLPVTADGCVVGDGCTVFREDANYEKMNRPRFYEFDVGRNRTRVATWSSREAAEAAKEAKVQTVANEHCKKCRCHISGHHGPAVGCEGCGVCGLTKKEVAAQ